MLLNISEIQIRLIMEIEKCPLNYIKIAICDVMLIRFQVNSLEFLNTGSGNHNDFQCSISGMFFRHDHIQPHQETS